MDQIVIVLMILLIIGRINVMTVKELIKQLQKRNQNKEVICIDENENEYDIDDIDLFITNKENQVIIGISRR